VTQKNHSAAQGNKTYLDDTNDAMNLDSASYSKHAKMLNKLMDGAK
jgi:hypothetical protein